ncbi:MAG: lipopolysaccharide biosynthesis protein RfbH, partial [Chloroflexi bacterium]|nr:lipopolysaccharide biosynthesis protein RfbH [Chloroflexota bacterium]
LVTGGTGFIGSHLVRRLLNEGARVSVFARAATEPGRLAGIASEIDLRTVDIRVSGAVDVAMEAVQPEVVFHLAAEGQTNPFLSHNLALKTNLEGTINVVRAAAASGARRIVHTSTSHEYGHHADQGTFDPISVYAASKAAAWSFVRMYQRTEGWPIVCLRLFQVYGPGQTDQLLISSAIRAALDGRSIRTTPGEQERDWVYIDDVVEAYVLAATAEGVDGHTFDIGSGQGMSVRDTVEAIYARFDGLEPQPGALPYRPGEVFSLVADTNQTEAVLGWRASVSFEDGLSRTIEALRAEQTLAVAEPGNMASTANASSRVEDLQADILEKVSEYYALTHQQSHWTPGETKVQYAGRVFDDREMRLMTESMLEFWLTAGRFAQAFETKLGHYLGVREVIPVNSGSSANLVAISTLMSKRLRTRPMERGDEVITTAVSFPTTIAPIVQNGLVPVLVDSQLGNYNVDVEQLEAALSPRTRAIFITHTLGNPVDMDAVMAFAGEHDLYVIEDNCDALGSRYNGQMTGTFGDFGTSSFYPAHHITLGEGGAVYTNRPHLAKIARTMRDWGRDCWCGYINPPNGRCGKRFEWTVDGIEGHYDHRYLYTEIGYNLKLTDPMASIGLAQIDKLPSFVATRKRNFRILYDGLRDLEPFFILPSWSEKADPSWFAFPITIRPEAPIDRNQLQRFLEERKIETRLLFAGNILKQPGYRGIPHRVIGELPVADLVLRNTFFVGVYPGLDVPQLEYMLNAFYDFVRREDFVPA